MKVAVACKECRLDSEVAERFGRAPAFIIYDSKMESTTKLAVGSRTQMPPDGGLQIAVTLLDAEVEGVVAGRFGRRVTDFFRGADVTIAQIQGEAGGSALHRFLHMHPDRSERMTT